MNAVRKIEIAKTCALCGVPVDAQHFDASRIIDLQAEPDALQPGRIEVMAEFKLPPEYCGVLNTFFQFTDTQAKDASRIDTPDFQWTIRVNGHPLYPYLGFKHILNPWSSSCCATAIRLDEGAVVDFIVRRLGRREADVNKVGARLVGRYWYNSTYGNGA